MTDTPTLWHSVDTYVDDLFIGSDSELDAALAACAAAGLPPIQVSAAQGKMLSVFAQLCSAKRILEIGTLGGYSTLWLARGLAAGGEVVTLEVDPKHAAVARQNFARHSNIKLVEGDALKTLPTLADGNLFDMVFIDADKRSTPDYYTWARKLTRVGGLIIVDNVVRAGAVIDSARTYPAIMGIREANRLMAADKGFNATILQTVGNKGYDGFAMGVVTQPA